MKKIVIVILLLITSNSFSQGNINFKTNDIYKISFNDSNKTVQTFEDVKVNSIDQNSITLQSENKDPVTGYYSYEIRSIPLEQLSSFGVRTAVPFGTRLIRGAIVGFGIGFLLGVIPENKFSFASHGEKATFSERLQTGVVFGLILAVPGILIGAVTGIGAKEFEDHSLSKFENKIKYEVIKNLIKKSTL